jgi:hypothetical protein
MPGCGGVLGGFDRFYENWGLRWRFTGDMRRTTILGVISVSMGAGGLLAAEFEVPVMVMGGGEPVGVESPGYAAPCRADVDGDGHPDLLVGQFNGGKIHCFPGQADGSYGKGTFLKADGEVASVPGIW